MKHKERREGWTNQVAKCDYACWWDCSFWCKNNKIFGKEKLAHERACPMSVPDFAKCSLK